MQKITLYIENHDGARSVSLEDEISVGRTDAANIALSDSGLSRLNTTFFRDGNAVLIVDENSTNGTFVNGERISGAPRQIFDGDQIKIGTETRIRIEIGEKPATVEQSNRSVSRPPENQKTNAQTPPPKPSAQAAKPAPNSPPVVLIAAVGSMFLIIFLGIGAYLVASRYENISIAGKKPVRRDVAPAAIPIRVVDPLGGGDVDENNLDDLIEAWEVQDAAFETKDLVEIKTSTDAPQLAVSVADWETQRNLAMGKRGAQIGLVSVQIPAELGGGITKQLAIFKQLNITPDTLPKDYAALIRLRAANKLVELPLATKFYYLDNIGTSADGAPFDSFDPATRLKSPLITNSEDFSIIQSLANNYNGQKYDLSDPASRLQMKRRLLRMFHPRAKAFLEELGAAYQAKFGRPLKVTSLTRSLEYQFDLTKDTRNAYTGRTPPHSTGATFDLAYMQMTADEQNFLMATLADYERKGRIDALREVAQTPCIHIFVYP